MNIAIVSVFNVSLLESFVYPEYRERIRQLDSNFTPAVATLTLELIRKGETIIIFTQDNKARQIEEFHGNNVHVYVAPLVTKAKRLLMCGLSTVFALKKLFPLHKEPIDIVSAHWTREYAIAAGEYIGRAPVYVTIRDIMPNILKQATSNRLRWRFIWLMNEYVVRKKGYKFIANSDYTAHEAKRYWGIEAPVVPNPVSITETDNTKEDQARDRNITVTTVSLGDFNVKWKNIPTLLKAFAIFRKTYPNAILNLIGPYFIEGNILAQAYAEDGLMDGVKLLGKKSPDEIKAILMKSTMMVHPSLEETFGNTIIESLECGIPVIGGINSGAVPWVLEHGKLGYICNVESIQAIADTMLYIVAHYHEALQKALKGRDKCITTFSTSHVADEYLRLFKNSQSS